MSLIRILQRFGLYFAWLITVIAMLITLYGSEILGQSVCNLCWYQRICMYPLVVILGIAAYYEDRRIFPYALPLAIIGFLFAAYQYMQQMIPKFAPIQLCGQGPTCSIPRFIWLGFITYPLLSMVAFLAIIIFLFSSKKIKVTNTALHSSKILVIITIISILLLITAFSFYKKNTPSPRVEINIENQPTIGNPDAKVNMVVFEDLKCPMCRAYSLTIFPLLKSKYIDTGKIKYTTIIVDFLPNSETVAISAYCVYAQQPTLFYPYIDLIYRNQGKEITHWATQKRLLALSKQIPGIDADKLVKCMNNELNITILDDNVKQAIRGKIFHVPTIIINGIKFRHLTPSDVFKLIDEQLKE